MSTEEKNIQDHEEAQGKLLIDHEYDGIKELDNKPPPWLMAILYGTIIFSAIYMLYFHILYPDDNQDTEYEKSVAAAQATIKVVEFDETNVALITDEAKLAEGLNLYNTKTCVACHGAAGEGNNIGPNLTDNAWLHGKTPAEIFKSIKYGIPEKGMTPFKDQLSNEQIQILTSYILGKMVGSNPANPKAPQGEAYE